MSAPATGRAGTWLMVVAAIVVAGAVVTALFVMDPPSRQRAERLDQARVVDLQRLSARIDAHAGIHDALPERLAVVDGAPGRPIVDPATGRPYQYEVTGERSYRLCATFETAVEEPRQAWPGRDEWRHGEGRQCFDRKVGQDATPVLPQK